MTPHFDERELANNGFMSQNGQDKWLIETLLPQRRGGVFVDVGAHDGYLLSNTYVLEKKFEWTGLAIEPHPIAFETLQQKRSCRAIHGCASARAGNRTFQIVHGYGAMLSGLSNEYDPRHSRRIQELVETKGSSTSEISVTCYRLADLLRSANIDRVDYLSVDVEGAELSVLKGIDWSSTDIAIIGVENNYADYKVPAFLYRRGYRMHSIVGDEFYVKR
jgi:FkbM family methyltransferase